MEGISLGVGEEAETANVRASTQSSWNPDGAE